MAFGQYLLADLSDVGGEIGIVVEAELGDDSRVVLRADLNLLGP